MMDQQLNQQRMVGGDTPSAGANPLYLYQTLPTDAWARCLSYLPPRDLMEKSIEDVLPLRNKNATTAAIEQAAELFVTSRIDVAKAWWRKAVVGPNKTFANPVNLRLRDIVAEDTSLVGDILRKSIGSDLFGVTDIPYFRPVLFQDETWSGLYDFVYRVLQTLDSLYMDSDGNRVDRYASLPMEGTIFTMCLIFGVTDLLTPLHTKCNKDSFEKYALGCVRHHRRASVFRCFDLALRFEHEEIWRCASGMLLNRCMSNRCLSDYKPRSLLDIDCAIGVCTFKTHYFYSIPFAQALRSLEDADKVDAFNLRDFAFAIIYGKEAVLAANERYRKALALAHPTQTRSYEGNRNSDDNNADGNCHPPVKRAKTSSRATPRSIFANDIIRCVYAKLALGRILAFVGRRIVCRRSPIYIEDLQRINSYGEAKSNADLAKYAIYDPLLIDGCDIDADYKEFPHLRLFQESLLQLLEGIAICEDAMAAPSRPPLRKKHKNSLEMLLHLQDNSRYKQQQGNRTIDMSIEIARDALLSAVAELEYCWAVFFDRTSKRELARTYTNLSVKQYHNVFANLGEKLIRSTRSSTNTITTTSDSNSTIALATRCGKDLGKVFCFAKRMGILRDDENSSAMLSSKTGLNVLGFVHLVSIYQHGCFHPSNDSMSLLQTPLDPSGEGTAAAVAAVNNELPRGQTKDKSSSSSSPLAKPYRTIAEWLVRITNNTPQSG